MRQVTFGLVLVSFASFPVAGQAPRSVPPPASKAPQYAYTVVRSYPHDRQAFTQGLEFVDGVLYESTGLNGRSGIRKVNLATGEVLQVQPLDPAYFGEGITVWKNRIVQLTWQSGLGFVYDRQTLQQQRTSVEIVREQPYRTTSAVPGQSLRLECEIPRLGWTKLEHRGRAVRRDRGRARDRRSRRARRQTDTDRTSPRSIQIHRRHGGPKRVARQFARGCPDRQCRTRRPGPDPNRKKICPP